MQGFCEFEPGALRRHAARFSAPVFPGETITVDLWKDGKTVSFEARVKSRNVIVVRNGLAELS
jgi:acyl dehydratase